MKKIIILTLLAVFTLGIQAADYNYLVFTLSDGTTKSISSSSLNITFSDGNMTATSGSSTVTIALTSLTKMEFSNNGETGIETIKTNFTLDDATEIYDMNGRRIPSGSALSRGVYIIKSNGKTQKIAVQ